MKKSVKIIAIATIIAIGIGGAVITFAGPHFNMRGGQRGRFGFMGREMFDETMIVSHLKERLNLTGEQEAQLLPIVKAQIEKQRALFEKNKGQAQQGLETMKNARQEMWQDMEKQLEGILTEEQMQEVRKMHDERQQFVQGRFQARGEFRQMFEELDLSVAQKAELFTIFMKYRDGRQNAMDNFFEMRSQFSNLILNEEFDEEKVRQTFRQSTGKFEEFVVSQAKMLAEMKAVLNPEQLQILQEKGPELFTKVQERMHARRGMFDKWFPHHSE